MTHETHGGGVAPCPEVTEPPDEWLAELSQIRQLADRIPQLVWSCQPDGCCDFLSRRWESYTGVPESEHHGHHWLDAIHADDRHRAEQEWHRFILGQTDYDLEYRLRRHDGVYRWFKARGQKLQAADGEVRRIFGTSTDIDDQKRAEAELRESRERLEAALAASGTGTFRWDLQTDALDWDEQLDRLFGLPTGAAVRSLAQFLALVHPDDRNEVMARCERCRDHGADFAMEFRVVWPDGTVRWLDDRGRTIRDLDGRPDYMTGACTDVTDRRRAEALHRESEARGREILESITDAFFALDPDWRFVYVNHQAEALLDRAPGDLLGKVLWEEYPGLNGSEFERVYRGVARDRVTASITGYYPDHGRWYETHAYPVASGGVTIYFRNATARIQAEQELAHLAEQRRLALDAAGLGAWHIDPATGALNTDERFRVIFGVEGDQISYEEALARVFADDRELVHAEVTAALDPTAARPYSIEHRIVHPDGSVRWVHAVGRGCFRGEGAARRLSSLDGTIADITERRAAEVALRQGERRLQAAHDLLEGITEGTEELIAALDRDYRFTVINAAYRRDFLRVFGTEALVGGSMIEALAHLPEDQRNAVELWGRALAGESVTVTMEFGDPGRARRVFDLRFNPIRDAEGRIVGAGEIARDVTERVRSEEALKEADRRKDEFLALLAHELRNPLAPLRNGLQELRLAGPDTGPAAEARQMMDRQLTHLVRLVDDLLDISRVSSGKMELRRRRVDLAEVIATAVETARPAVDAGCHALAIDGPSAPLFLDADLTRLAQVVANLLTNAARYTEPGGQIRVAADRQGDEVVLSVSDTGIGLPPDALAHIFDMFSQVDRSVERATGGLGIGLALVKGLVEMHGGQVTAESPGPGLGSTFRVRLPLAAAPDRVARAGPSPRRRAIGPTRRVLVVDDNRDAALSMARVLKLMGHTVETAADGVDAIAAAERFRPELILMDVGMPRLNGYEATRQIRTTEWGGTVTVLALTGWGQPGDRAQSAEAGCDGHLVKPIELSDLEPYLAACGPDRPRPGPAR